MKREALCVAGLIALSLAAHASVVRQWWMWDDPQLLFAVVNWPFHELLFSPPAWQAQSGANFVPALLAGFKVDLLLFGLEPLGFYLHHLVTFTAAIILFYVYLSRFANRGAAWVAAAAATLGASGFTVAHLLMNRHYAEGLLLSAGAMLFFLRSEERPIHGVAAALLYFLAALEKEVFAPLPLLVFVQDVVVGHRLRTMIRNLTFCSVSAATYLAWRIVMLGSAGGFGFQRPLREAPRFAADVWAHIVGSSVTTTTVAAAALAVIVAAVAIRDAKWRAILVMVAAAIFIALPLLGLRLLDHRHVFIAMVLCLALGACAVGRAKYATIRFVAFAAMAGIFMTAGLRHYVITLPEWEGMQRDGRYLWTAPANARPLLSVPNGWYVEGVRWLRENVRRERTPRAIASIPGLVVSGLSPVQIVSLHRDPEAVAKLHRELRAGYEGDQPVSIRIVRRGRQMSWRFDPDAAGVGWYFMAMPAMDLVKLAPHGALPLPSHLRAPSYDATPQGSHFRILRTAGVNWTATPDLPFPRSDGGVVWERKPPPRTADVRR